MREIEILAYVRGIERTRAGEKYHPGDRNPRYARGKPHQEIQSEILTCGLQGSHTETDDQKIPIALNDYRDFLVSHYMHMSDTGISLRENSHALRLASELADLLSLTNYGTETYPPSSNALVAING